MDYNTLTNSVKEICLKAGLIILKHYNSENVDQTIKTDASPLTAADLESNAFICSELAKLTPHIPVISEENIPESYVIRKEWSTYWLVDPLDGTKEFLKKTGQFTVNIGLISDGKPVLGVIDIPVMGQRYYSAKGFGSWIEQYGNNNEPDQIKVRNLDANNIDIVASKDHAGPLVQALSENLPNAGFKSMGSSLKFCLVASGEADVYLRDVPTMEWDTAAAHAILLEAGGQIYTLDGEPLQYNKESLTNPAIVSIGNNSDFWLDLVSKIQKKHF